MDVSTLSHSCMVVVALCLIAPAGLQAGEPDEESDVVKQKAAEELEGSGQKIPEEADVRLTRPDVETLYESIVADLDGAEVFEDRADGEKQPVMAFPPIEVTTSRDVGPGVNAFHMKIETHVVNKVPVDLINLANQEQLLEERRRHPDYDGEESDPESVVDLRLDIELYIDESASSDESAVTFVVVTEVIDADTDNAVFHSKNTLTKRPND